MKKKLIFERGGENGDYVVAHRVGIIVLTTFY